MRMAKTIILPGGNDDDLRIDRIQKDLAGRGFAAMMRAFEDGGSQVQIAGDECPTLHHPQYHLTGETDLTHR